jgi:xanthine dehydrogenase accessory factor
MREVAQTIEDWLDSGHRVAVARVVDIRGFGSVPAGELLAVRDDGVTAGGLLRGVADDPVGRAIARALGGETVVVDAPVPETAAVAAGLACAGTARILVHAGGGAPARAAWSALARGASAALASALHGDAALAVVRDRTESVGSFGDPQLDEDLRHEAARLLEAGAAARAVRSRHDPHATGSARVSAQPDDVLIDAWAPVPTVITIGGGVLAAAIAAQATLLGWAARDVTGVDDAVTAVAAFGPADVLVLLDHDPAFDAVLRAGLAHGRGFLGALGSRRTQAARRERLAAAGVPGAALDRVHGPVGLDLGARGPAETAVSIVAEVLATRAGRSGEALRTNAVPIH